MTLVSPSAPTPSLPSGSTIEGLRRILADESRLREALAEADIVPQLMLDAQLSGKSDLLETSRPYIHGGWSFMEDIPAPLRKMIQDRLIETIKAAVNATQPSFGRISSERLSEIISSGIGQNIEPEYLPLFLEEMYDTGSMQASLKDRAPPNFKVIVIGAGLSGLCMGHRLRSAGIDFTIFEKNDAVGGTWYENSYPGAGVDIPNHFYSFSFAPKHNWSHHFAKRDELWEYLEECADKFDVRRDIRFKTEVLSAHYDEATALWKVTLRNPDGKIETTKANILISGVGQLNRPSVPTIPGLESFSGPVFHTAEWDHIQDLTGKRVALVGTGASSMQVGPTIAGDVKRLLVFQRSPNWAANNPNYLLPVKPGMQWALENIPLFAKWYRLLLFWASGDALHASLQLDPQWQHPEPSLNADNLAMRRNLINYIKSEIGDDPELLKKVIPDYPPYGKRMLRDNNWYKMLKRDNVDLIDAAVAKIEPNAIVDTNGASYPVDMIVFATGFQASRMLWPLDIAGRNKRTIRDEWGDDNPRAHLGITSPGFPNMFLLYGPNTNLAHGGSLFFHAECQTRYIMAALETMFDGNFAEIECRLEPHDVYNAKVDAAHGKMVWTWSGVKNWYKNSAGRVVTNSPWRLVDYWQLTRTFNPDDFAFRPASRHSS